MAGEIRIIRTDKEQPPLAVQSLDVSRNIINPAKEDGNLALIKSNTDNLDVALSTRASELTLQQIKQNTDKIPTNPAKEDGNLATIKANTNNLDIALSTRASETTLTQLKDKVGRFPDSNFLTVYSYTTNLSDNQVISSNFINVSYYRWLQIYAKTDKTGQLALIWSDDGVNEDSREFLYPGYGIYQEKVKIKSNYLKVEYTNGLATTTFKLIVYAKL